MREHDKNLEVLADLALNLRSSWNHGADELWAQIDPELWAKTSNPWVVVQSASPARLRALLATPAFKKHLLAARDRLNDLLVSAAWFQKAHPGARLQRVAYFSMEFGLTEALPIYSGGLGNVAGDQLKAASDLGVPVVGVGLLYQQGYFRQVIAGGWQSGRPLPVQRPAPPPHRSVADARRVRCCVSPSSSPARPSGCAPGRRASAAPRSISSTATTRRTRRRSAASPASSTVAARSFACSRRSFSASAAGGSFARSGMRARGLSPERGPRRLRGAGTRRRLHGEDRPALRRRARGDPRRQPLHHAHPGRGRLRPVRARAHARHRRQFYAEKRLGISLDELLALGRQNPRDPGEPFNMAYLAIRGSGAVNGVSRLHGEVSRRIFQSLFPRWPEAEVPVAHVTNGVHTPSWDSPEADALWTRTVGPRRWQRHARRRRAELPLRRRRRALGDAARRPPAPHRVRARAHRAAARRRRSPRRGRGRGAARPRPLDARLRAPVRRLTSGRTSFSATRIGCVRILTNQERPVQLVVAGKAHPADGFGTADDQELAPLHQPHRGARSRRLHRRLRSPPRRVPRPRRRPLDQHAAAAPGRRAARAG